ncbi:DUF411 domain-containing protein (plasmid) [Azospirillum oryzae]|uniref:DUF411 domain-containing protein n=2 Tax=Azospirillaceae TaxID=2829815 RepID=A0A6N1AUB7_9PROT|nr:DUF411 domain-containing protein [Azospirillum oryzae]PWC91123.1 hypothetical protein TSO5_19690 [Azospirillum sp. TSO5]QCG99453.1 DUF411 domain-containing protein [Azospirillum sp. TSA2s]QKS54828.1 DUF411 domain-containing protein [Azospirillum oryzae]
MQRLRGARWGLLLGVGLVGVHLIAGSALFESTPAAAADLTVWKSPTCDCCGKWIEHMRAAGFSIVVRDVEDMHRIRTGQVVPEALRSCHTAMMDGYVLEGHVPASDVNRLLTEKPQLKGLSVPGMPASAPGMDHPGHPYGVVTFGRTGGGLYASH